MQTILQTANFKCTLELTQAWNDCLLECGKQLTALLIDYHTHRYENLLTVINESIPKEFNSILQNHASEVPELQSKLLHSHKEITDIMSSTEQAMLQSHKKSSNSNQETTNKKQKNDQDEDPISEKVKSAINEIL